MKDTVDPTVEHYVMTSAKSGAPTLQVVLSDGRKRFLHSPYDPQEEAQRWAAMQEFGPRDIVVVFGIGLGYHVQELVPLLSPTNRLILVEADPSLQNYLASDRRKSSARVPSLAQVVELRKLARLFDDIPFVQWTPLRLLALPAFTEIFAQAWQEAATEIHRLLSTYLVFRNTVLKFSMLWHENFYTNLPTVIESAPIARTFGLLRGKPGIVVSAGPSLEKNVELLREAHEKAVVVATGTAARLLHQKSIPFDFVISLDPGEHNYKALFQDVSYPEAVLLYDPVVDPQVLESHTGSKAVFFTYPDESWLEEYGSEPVGFLANGGSVAHTAFDFLCRLGADPVILVGQDLAYPGNKSHAEGTYHPSYRIDIPEEWIRGDEEALARRAKKDFRARCFLEARRITVPSIDGGTVLTDRKLLTFLHWFEQAVEAQNGRRRVIDATEGGALIRGTEIFTLRQALDRFCTGSAQDTRNRILRELKEPLHISVPRLADSLSYVLRIMKRCREHMQAWMTWKEDLEQTGKVKLSERERVALCESAEQTLRSVGRLRKFIPFALAPTLTALPQLGTLHPDDAIEHYARYLQVFLQLEHELEAAAEPVRKAVGRLMDEQLRKMSGYRAQVGSLQGTTQSSEERKL